MLETLHDKVTGRVRFKVPGLNRSCFLKDLLERRLMERRDIISAKANVLTGNILVSFNTHQDPQRIGQAITFILDEAQTRKNTIEPPAVPAARAGDAPARTSRAALAPASTWHLTHRDAVTAALQSHRKTGLSRALALQRLAAEGENRIPDPKKRSAWDIFAEQINSLPTYLLGAAAGVSLLTGGLIEAGVILGVVMANAAIGYYTEDQAEKTIDSLKELVHPEAEVLRDGDLQTVPAEHVVPGDLLVLAPGRYVSADCRVVKSSRLTIDESMLTGESLPVLKSTDALSGKDIPLADRRNMAFMGTLVTGGQGLGMVVATGSHSEMGRLQVLLQDTVRPQTPIERQLARMGDQLVLLCGGICGIVFGLGFLRGYGMVQMLKTAISLAAAAVPEGLPAAATVNFAISITNMRKHRVLVRQLRAIETLGAVQTICLDKTGTITQNTMQVQEFQCGAKRITHEDRRFWMNGGPVSPLAHQELDWLLRVCVLCSETRVNGNRDSGGHELSLSGSSTEKALVQAASHAGLDPAALQQRHRRLKMTHRSESRLLMSTLHRHDGRQRILSVKGSPPEVLTLCSRHMIDGQVKPLDESGRLQVETANERMAGQALRVLGVAYRIVDAPDEKVREEDLIWLGLVGMSDPVREGARELIAMFHAAGVETVMITGDQSSTACAVAQALHLSGEKPLEILDSSELSALNDDTLKALATKVHVYSRVSPTHKLKIVEALRAAGRTVAMTGDGINDGPALKAADIGIAMGRSGTDVARDVADIILEEDNLEILAMALRDGRATYQNIRKALHFFLATNISEIQLMFISMAAGIGFPLNVMQLMWINIISDIFPGLALSMETPDPGVLSDPPRDPAAPILSGKDFRRMLVESGWITGAALAAYGFGLSRYGLGARAGSLAFQTLTLSQLLHAYSCRSETRPARHAEKPPANPYLNWAMAGSLALQALTMLLPPLRNFMGLARPGLADLAVIGVTSVLPYAVSTCTKPIQTRPAP